MATTLEGSAAMPTNNVIVSDDGREMIVTTPHGTIVTLRSEHESGFTAEQIERAREYDFPKLISGELVTR